MDKTLYFQCLDTDEFNAGAWGKPAMDEHQTLGIKVRRNTSSRFMPYQTTDKSFPDGPLGRNSEFTLLPYTVHTLTYCNVLPTPHLETSFCCALLA